MSNRPLRKPQLIDSPLAQTRVQWWLVAAAAVAVVFMIVTGTFSEAQHSGVQKGEKTTRLRIDLNRAAARELALLPGVGPVLARRIVRDRERLGNFRSLDDLSRVHGIGPKKLSQLGDVCHVSADD